MASYIPANKHRVEEKKIRYSLYTLIRYIEEECICILTDVYSCICRWCQYYTAKALITFYIYWKTYMQHMLKLVANMHPCFCSCRHSRVKPCFIKISKFSQAISSHGHVIKKPSRSSNPWQKTIFNGIQLMYHDIFPSSQSSPQFLQWNYAH